MSKNKRFLLSSALFTFMSTVGFSCHKAAPAVALPDGIPTHLAPADNPFTVEKAVLGRFLFYDKRLSGDGTMACATCHSPALSFTDQKALPRGIPSGTGTILPRSAPNLTNAGFTRSYTWINEGLKILEAQAMVPLFLDNIALEMGLVGHEKQALEKLRTEEYYRQMFKAAFPGEDDPFTIANVIRGIASFERTLVSFNSPFDRFEKGDKASLSEKAQKGRDLFFSERAKCSQCHSGRFFTDAQDPDRQGEEYFHNNGIHAKFPDESGNEGVSEVSHKKRDLGKFKTPTLRNVALTYPFMHDGSINCDEGFRGKPGTYSETCAKQALGRVIDHYSAGGKKHPNQDKRITGFSLSPTEREQLIEFLLALTDTSFTSHPFYQTPRPNDDHFAQ